MLDSVYLVDPVTNKPTAVQPVSFAQLGVKERSDLQEWILTHPAILGEDLLVITSEFSGFDRTNDRLDILALDKSGTLTVVELKLDANRTLADLQALRYAAYCSTMTMEDAAARYAERNSCSNSDAAEAICMFLSADELPELKGEPRIILGAGSIDDLKLTSTVLWLRKFSVDISCVEITPYRLPGSQQVMLVPRTLIPLREAREYIIGVERKESQQIQKVRTEKEVQPAFQAVTQAFNALNYDGFSAKATKHYSIVQSNLLRGKLHYEFWFDSEGSYTIGLHSQFEDLPSSLAHIQPVLDDWDAIAAQFGLEHKSGKWRRNWAAVWVVLPPDPTATLEASAKLAAETMRKLIELTYPKLVAGGVIRGDTLE